MKKTDYCEIATQILQLRGYSERTIEAYIPVMDDFFRWLDVPPTKANANHFKEFFMEFKDSSVSKKNQVISAMKFLYVEVLKRKYGKVDFRRPRCEKKVPRLVDHNMLIEKISRITNLKHKAILTLAYSDGLRVSEVINLKMEDIDSNAKRIYIRNAKGRKDRIVPLSSFVLKLLREYYWQHKPKVYLFNGQNSLQYSATSCRKIMKKYVGNFRFHDLRHSCITHLVEMDTALPKVASFAGHSSTRTVAGYTHLSAKSLDSLRLPV